MARPIHALANSLGFRSSTHKWGGWHSTYQPHTQMRFCVDCSEFDIRTKPDADSTKAEKE